MVLKRRLAGLTSQKNQSHTPAAPQDQRELLLGRTVRGVSCLEADEDP